MKSKKHDAHPYEFPVEDINWTVGIGQPAGMFWVDGRVVMAAHRSPAEAELLRLGAVLVATLRFDADPREAVHRTGAVERISAAAAAAALLNAAPN